MRKQFDDYFANITIKIDICQVFVRVHSRKRPLTRPSDPLSPEGEGEVTIGCFRLSNIKNYDRDYY